MQGLLLLLVVAAGLAQIALGFIGLQDWLGSLWAFGALGLAFFARIMLPLTIGTFFAVTNVYGFDWWVGILVAAPGLLLIAPAMVSDVLSKVFKS